jgi:hypothetical protein
MDQTVSESTQQKPLEGSAIATILFGIFGFFGLGLLFSIPGLITGHYALWKLNHSDAKRGIRISKIGLALCYLTTATSIVIIILLQMEWLGIPWDSFTYHITSE